MVSVYRVAQRRSFLPRKVQWATPIVGKIPSELGNGISSVLSGFFLYTNFQAGIPVCLVLVADCDSVESRGYAGAGNLLFNSAEESPEATASRAPRDHSYYPMDSGSAAGSRVGCRISSLHSTHGPTAIVKKNRWRTIHQTNGSLYIRLVVCSTAPISHCCQK